MGNQLNLIRWIFESFAKTISEPSHMAKRTTLTLSSLLNEQIRHYLGFPLHDHVPAAEEN